ncbi:PKD domain-containing protein [Pinibacter soli]|uniref:PKD domain-containing protein n=1 Tax=Pinibacter soli TaxID=3044211 RepID=A0ABT6RID4_9BACT|nr:PKD domain-containing protein [Pinibacter soli]MDI3322288.1 PKD domain-containing protein [Pinibacter soli]
MRSILLIVLMTAYSFFAGAQTLTSHNITSAGHPNIGFYDFKPADYTTNPAQKFPLIIPLHGLGEKGDGTTQLNLVFTSGIGYQVKNGASMRFNYPNGVKGSFLVLLPQLSSSYGDWQPFYIDEMIKWAKANLNVDTNKVYITGYSLGGGGTWVYPASSVLAASQVTAVIPVSGTGLSQGNACNIAQGGTAVWAIHTTDDNQVSVYSTMGVVNAVLGCGPKNPVFGWYPVGNHQIYDGKIYPDTANRYSYPTIYQYMLGMNKKNTPQTNLSPVANVGATDTTVVVNSSMMFYQKRITAELSTDPNDVIFHYNWQITSNNLSKVWPFGGYQQVDTSTAWPAHDLDYKNWSWPWQDLEFHALGDYTFKLTVTDTYGATSTQTKTIHITNNGQNTAPVVNLGPDLTLASGVTTASFTGTQVFDWEAQAMTYKVTQEAGPVNATLSANNWYQFNVSGLTAPGTYTFKVAATDAGGATGVDYVNVVVPGGANNPPVAKISAPSSVILPVASVTLDGSGSTDSDGSISAYLWSQTAGPNTANIVTPSAKTTVINGLVAGTYTFQLKVTDNLGAAGFTSATVTVSAGANVPPTAKITGPTSITLPTNSVTFDGSTSTDSDGSIATYNWYEGYGPNSATIATPTAKSTTVSGLVAGTYQFILAVTDNQSARDTEFVILTVNPAVSNNKPPVANAGNDFTTSNSYAYLSAGGSYDPDGSIAGYNWTQVSGPNTATILSGNSMFPTVQGLVSGSYVFRVTVTDNQGATASDDVQLTVGGNKPPVANAGADFTVNAATTASLSASGSSDPDGTIASYSWTQVSGPNTATIASANTVSPTAQGLIVGVYVFRVTVTDNLGASATDDVQVTVANNSNNKAPIANAGNDFSTTSSYAYLSAGGSYDPDGSIAGYNWIQVSGPNTAQILSGNTMFPTVQGLVNGNYVFRVTVTDNMGATASDDVQLTVGSGTNKPPVANAGADFTVNATTTASLSASGSSDPDGSIASYSWTQVSGPNTATIASANTVSPTAQGLIVGVYVFRVTVTDNLGATATDDVQVTVTNNSNNKPPVANAGNDFSTSNNYAYLSAGASYDPDGSIAAFQWAQVSGPNAATILSGNTMFPTVQGLVSGTYVFRVTVTDNLGAIDTDHVSMTVTNLVAGAMITQSVVTARDSVAVQISIYPNPATTQITVSSTNNFAGNYKVIVYDAVGKIEAQYSFVKPAAGLVKQQLDISRLAVGLHYVETIYEGNQHSTIQKFMKQ